MSLRDCKGEAIQLFVDSTRSEVGRVKKSEMSDFGNKNVLKKTLKRVNIRLKYRQNLSHAKGQKSVI